VLKVGRPRFNILAESGQKTLKVGIHSMDVGSGGQEGAAANLNSHRWYRKSRGKLKEVLNPNFWPLSFELNKK